MVGNDITTGSLALIDRHGQVELSLLFEYKWAEDPKRCQWLNVDPVHHGVGGDWEVLRKSLALGV